MFGAVCCSIRQLAPVVTVSLAFGGCVTGPGTESTAAAEQSRAEPAGPDAGVSPTLLMDREEIRIFRVVLAPGAVRSVHSHDDVAYHAWVPLEGSLELAIEGAPPVSAAPGGSHYLEPGTRHGFRNLGPTPAEVMEIFVYDDAPGR